MDGKVGWVVSTRLSSRNLISAQEDIVSCRIETNGFDITYPTMADPILPFHVHDQGHGGNVAKCQDEISVEQK